MDTAKFMVYNYIFFIVAHIANIANKSDMEYDIARKMNNTAKTSFEGAHYGGAREFVGRSDWYPEL